MDRELLLEIGCEELPASWLPDLTHQIGEILSAQLREHRLAPESPAETFSTPRRLTVRIVRIPERQLDLEELVNGPPVSASFKPDGSATPAAAGFAAKQGGEVGALERVRTPKGEYLAFRRRQRGKAAVDVLPNLHGVQSAALQFFSREAIYGVKVQPQSGAGTEFERGGAIRYRRRQHHRIQSRAKAALGLAHTRRPCAGVSGKLGTALRCIHAEACTSS